MPYLQEWPFFGGRGYKTSLAKPGCEKHCFDSLPTASANGSARPRVCENSKDAGIRSRPRLPSCSVVHACGFDRPNCIRFRESAHSEILVSSFHTPWTRCCHLTLSNLRVRCRTPSRQFERLCRYHWEAKPRFRKRFAKGVALFPKAEPRQIFRLMYYPRLPSIAESLLEST